MRFVVHQCSALQGAAILAALARWRRQYHMLEGDALGACNWDRVSWVYDELATGRILPALATGRPEPELEDYEPPIEPSPVVIIQKPRLVTSGAAEHLLQKVIVRRPTLVSVGRAWEEESQSA